MVSTTGTLAMNARALPALVVVRPRRCARTRLRTPHVASEHHRRRPLWSRYTPAQVGSAQARSRDRSGPTQVVDSLPGDAAKCICSGLGRGRATAVAGLVVTAAGVTLIRRRPATEPSVGATRREPGLLVE